jgi:hypothetical protein
MADGTLASLGAVGTLADADLLYADDGPGVDGKVTGTVLKAYTSASPTLVTPDLGVPSAGDISACTSTSQVLTTPVIDDSDAGLTLTSADQTNGSAVATVPDIGDAADSFVMNDTAATLTGKTLTAPIIVTGGFIADAGGDELLGFTEDTTPVNFVVVRSGDTGVPCAVKAGGSDTNVDLLLVGQLTGNVVVADGTDETKDVVFELAGATTAKTTTLAISQTDDRTLTLPDATDTLVGKATTDVLTNKTLTTPVINGGSYNGAAMTTEEGSGWAGAAAYSSEITVVGKKITTQIFVDIAGLVVSTTLNDIIGDSAAANSHGGQFLPAESGTVYTSGSITCLEAPTVGDADIDFTVAVESNGAESADVSGLTTPVILLANTEAWTLGMTKPMALLPDATSDYLYLSNGVGGGPGTYGAGQFVIELIGYEA